MKKKLSLIFTSRPIPWICLISLVIFIYFAHEYQTDFSSLFEDFLTTLPRSAPALYAFVFLIVSILGYIFMQLKAGKSWHELGSSLIVSIIFPITLGILVLTSTGILKDFSELKESSVRQEKDISFNEGLQYYTQGDYEKASVAWKALAKSGNAKAQFALAEMYSEGRGVSQNYGQAIKLLKEAAEQGYVHAQFNLGIMYENGQGVDENIEEAFKWYEKAAEQGFAPAQTNLGAIYHDGEGGITQNLDEAFKWFSKAAKQGFVPAQNNLGIIYTNREGTPEDYIKAYMWFHIAVINGLDKAKSRIEHIEGTMTDEQIAEAKEMAKRCIESGYENCGEK